MSNRNVLKACCFFSAGISSLFALTAILLKMSKVITNHDGWLFWGVGMGAWLVLMVLGFAIKSD